MEGHAYSNQLPVTFGQRSCLATLSRIIALTPARLNAPTSGSNEGSGVT